MAGKRQALGPHSGEPAVAGLGPNAVTRSTSSAPPASSTTRMWHRTYWVYGRSFAGGHAGYSQAGKYAPSARIMVVDDDRVYGFGREPQYYRWTTPIEHHLWAADKQAPEVPKPSAQRRGATAERPAADGARVCVDKSTSLDPTRKPVAVEAWVKADKPDGVILAHGGSRLGYALYLTGGRPSFAVRSDSKLATATADQKVPDGWVHLAGLLTADKELRLYVDGKLAATGQAPGLIAADPNNPMEIGEDASSPVGDYKAPFHFTGLIDEVRVYYGKVDPDEIAPRTAATKPTDAKDTRLVLSMSFDAGDAKDESGRGNHGRIEGAKPVEGKLNGALSFAALPGAPAKPAAKKPAAKKPAAKKPAATGQRGFHVAHHWSQPLPLVARAMVLSKNALFVAGPPDVLDEDEADKRLGTPEIQANIAEQDEALAGRRGGLLWAVSPHDGSKLGELQLDAPPAWDGMAAAGQRLYLTTVDGKVLCLCGK